MNYKNTTQTPNILFDHHLKTLTETELKILLTVIRKTVGQLYPKYSKRRKQRAWITQRLFCICTGKSARAVSSALDTLSRKGLLIITDSNKTILNSKAKRRGTSRLYYESCLGLQEPAPAASEHSYTSAVKQVHTIKLNDIKQSCYNSSQCFQKLSDTERYRQIRNTYLSK